MSDSKSGPEWPARIYRHKLVLNVAMPTPPGHDAIPFFYGLSEDVYEVLLHEPELEQREVPEALVQDLWHHQRFNCSGLTTVDGIPVRILDPGRLNTDQGPDFLDARLELGSTSWVGAVEVHTTSGIWIDHAHEKDPVYNSTVLHVSLYSDIWTGRIRRADGTLLPEIVLYPRIEAPLRRLIHAFHTRTDRALACASGWKRVPEAVRNSWIRLLAVERFEQKKCKAGSADSLDRRLYEDIFSGLGYSKNAGAMRSLARAVPIEQARQFDDPLDLEAVYLGCAGLIPEPANLLHADRETADYAMELRDRYERFRHRLALQAMPPTAWRFFRLRPANFPPLRIAQAAALFSPTGGFLRDRPIEEARLVVVKKADRVRALRKLFDVRLSTFWRDHVRLERRSRRHTTAIGTTRIDALLINALFPALGTHADRTDDRQLATALIETAGQLPANSDIVIRRFEALGTPPANALDAQGLHQLFRTRCTQARCLMCDIGRHLLADSSTSGKLPRQ